MADGAGGSFSDEGVNGRTVPVISVLVVMVVVVDEEVGGAEGPPPSPVLSVMFRLPLKPPLLCL